MITDMQKLPPSNPQRWTRILALLILAHGPVGLLAESSESLEAKESKVQAAKEVEDTRRKERRKEVESDSSTAKDAGVAVPSPVQSEVRPMGLSLVGPVMSAGSDTGSATFQTTLLLSLTEFLDTKLSQTKKVDDAAMLLDLSKLKLLTDSDVRAYFVGEGAGDKNTLGFNISGVGVGNGDPYLIFPHASSPVASYDSSSKAVRSPSSPLLPGDFVDLGKMPSGTALNFFLIANGANGGMNVHSTDRTANPDGINHVVSFAYATPASSFLIIGFEDLLGGGDRDSNDLVFAVDIGARNIAALTGTPILSAPCEAG